MTSKERVHASLNHRQPDRIPVDFGSSFITGIHCSVVEKLREYYGLEKRLVKAVEPYQMLGLVEDDLKDAMGLDVTSIFPRRTIFGFPNEDWKEFRTPWGQDVLVSKHFNTRRESNGDIYIYPEGDMSAPASGHMPATSYFFDTIVRQEPYDEDELDVEDNLEEFQLMGEEEKAYWRREAEALRGNERAVVTHLGGTCLGDIALVPGPFLKNPKGVRGIEDWIHEHTTWKTFKHSCGAIDPLIPDLISSGFDILNPVQCSATGMEAPHLKSTYGDKLTFWGGGVNTQQTLPFGTPEEVRAEVAERCRTFGPGGGFIFNTIHNIQACTPVENVVAMLDTVRGFRL